MKKAEVDAPRYCGLLYYGYIHSHSAQFRAEIQEALAVEDRLGLHGADAASEHLLRWEQRVLNAFAWHRRIALFILEN